MARYLEVKSDLLGKIHSGYYKPGDKIPSERNLCEAYNVSRMTVRQALNELEAEGVVYRETGRGTFVSVPDLYQENLRSFTETLIEQNMKPTTRVLEYSTVSKLVNVSVLLDLPDTTSYYKIKRLRLGDGVPIAIETVYIPVTYTPDLIEYSMERSLYKVLEDQYGLEPSHIACEIEACISNRILMGMLELKNQKALLKVVGVTYDQNSRKLFYEESYYVSDLYKYHVDILGRP